MKNKEFPEDNVDVMVIYKKTVTFGDYNSESRQDIVTKRGFYSKLFNNFSIPPRWAKFKGILLPYGFGGGHLPADKIIEWKPIND